MRTARWRGRLSTAASGRTSQNAVGHESLEVSPFGALVYASVDANQQFSEQLLLPRSLLPKEGDTTYR